MLQILFYLFVVGTVIFFTVTATPRKYNKILNKLTSIEEKKLDKHKS